MESRKPFYWVVPQELAAGPYPGSQDPAVCREKLQELVGEGIRAFLDLTEPDEVSRLGRLVPYQSTLEELSGERGVSVTYRRFAVEDLTAPTPLTMLQILDHLDDEIAAGRPAYVHCLGGKGRTGVVVGCYLLRHADRLLDPAEPPSAQAALEQIVRLRAGQGIPAAWDSPQTISQIDLVRRWQVGV